MSEIRVGLFGLVKVKDSEYLALVEGWDFGNMIESGKIGDLIFMYG